MQYSSPSQDYIPGDGVVGVGLGTKTDSGVEGVTTASEDVRIAKDVTMSDDVMSDDVTMLDNPTSDVAE